MTTITTKLAQRMREHAEHIIELERETPDSVDVLHAYDRADELFCATNVLALLDSINAVIDRLNGSGYETRDGGVNSDNVVEVLDILLKQLSDASESEAAAVEALAAKDKQIAELTAGWGNCQKTMGVYCHAYEEAKDHIVDLNDQLQAVKKNASAWFKGMENAVRIGARYEERIAELEARPEQQFTVPDKMTTDPDADVIDPGFVSGWNACRSAMLDSVPFPAPAAQPVTVKLPVSVLYRANLKNELPLIYAYPAAELISSLAAQGITIVEGE